jgi:hypothetical protein
VHQPAVNVEVVANHARRVEAFLENLPGASLRRGGTFWLWAFAPSQGSIA